MYVYDMIIVEPIIERFLEILGEPSDNFIVNSFLHESVAIF